MSDVSANLSYGGDVDFDGCWIRIKAPYGAIAGSVEAFADSEKSKKLNIDESQLDCGYVWVEITMPRKNTGFITCKVVD